MLIGEPWKNFIGRMLGVISLRTPPFLTPDGVSRFRDGAVRGRDEGHSPAIRRRVLFDQNQRLKGRRLTGTFVALGLRMDIPRPENKKRKRVRQLAIGGGTALLLVAVTIGLARLEPAAPSVSRA